ncbi:hypothetical protein QE152_g34880 [Popillia japonica]|uniref:Uncharacterized protein n=1 Tax=Popillia japonica TaxID=7064 RepID=A0AAW1IT79_POPJA
MYEVAKKDIEDKDHQINFLRAKDHIHRRRWRHSRTVPIELLIEERKRHYESEHHIHRRRWRHSRTVPIELLIEERKRHYESELKKIVGPACAKKWQDKWDTSSSGRRSSGLHARRSGKISGTPVPVEDGCGG